MIHLEAPKIVRDMIQSETPQIVSQAIRRETPKLINDALKPIKRDLKKIRSDLEMAIGVLDKDRWELAREVDRIKTRLPPTAI